MAQTTLPLSPSDLQAQPQDDGVQYPGLQLPIQHLPPVRFKHAIADAVNGQPITVRELRMLAFINQITDKPDWHVKVYDDAILEKWKEEASCAVQAGKREDELLSESMFAYCIAELQDKAKRSQSTGFVTVYDVDLNCKVAKSDTAVSQELLDQLKTLVKPLEDVPDDRKDWHPGSDGKVLDLVHPSLFPLILGRSRAISGKTVPRTDCITYSGSGALTKNAPEGEDALFRRPPTFAGGAQFANGWGSYQWLPSDILFDDDGKARISSYINNLHPRHHVNLYNTFEKIIDAAIPLWNEVLSEHGDCIRIKIGYTSDEDYALIKGRRYPHDVTPVGLQVVHPENSDDDTDPDLSCDDDYRDWKRANSILLWPEPETSYRPFEDQIRDEGTNMVDLIRQFRKTGLQIIFKLANIILTPESPNYGGGSWHIEGALNEHIAATAIIYYDQENITDSQLSFRHAIDSETLIVLHAQEEYDSLCEFYGVEYEGTNEQDIGSVLTKEGRILCFPNTIQHRVGDFELADKTKPGHRKILAMFLVDPHIPILSTANVPPQRKDWWIEETLKIPQFAQLPVEVFEGVVDAAEGLLTWNEAVDVRDKLMAERTVINDDSINGLTVNHYIRKYLNSTDA